MTVATFAPQSTPALNAKLTRRATARARASYRATERDSLVTLIQGGTLGRALEVFDQGMRDQDFEIALDLAGEAAAEIAAAVESMLPGVIGTMVERFRDACPWVLLAAPAAAPRIHRGGTES